MDFKFLDLTENRTGAKYALAQKISKLSKRLLGHELLIALDSEGMLTVEQASNIFNLTEQTLAYKVEGDVVECGSFTGSTAIQIQNCLVQNNSSKAFHVFDSFDEKFFFKGKNTFDTFKSNFEKFNLPLPVIHKGYFNTTIPEQLPQKIAFAHIDCGFGDTPSNHSALIVELLNHIYARLTSGAICLFMDYYHTGVTVNGTDSNPGVKLGCDAFFKDKPEKVSTLYGGKFSHGFMRKQ